jgi:hypothetical protein
MRLLSSSDIYDIANLKNPGACGAYAVFIKKNIEKRLLSFVADVSGAPVEILYQNPSKMLPAETRKAICRDLAQTMVTLVATVVALLASIQVKSDSRAAAARVATKPAVQAGGADIADVIDWLYANGYIRERPTKTSEEFVKLDLYNADLARYGATAPQFKLRLERRPSANRTYNGTITVTGGKNYPSDAGKEMPIFPDGALQVQVMAPIRIPGGAAEESILPFRLADQSSLTWMAGALYKSVFFSAAGVAEPKAISPFEVWVDMFRLTQGFDLYKDRETRPEINRGAEAFNQYVRTQDARVFLQAMAPLLTRYTLYSPETTVGYPPSVPYAAPYPIVPPGYPPLPAARPLPAPLPTGISRPIQPAMAITPATAPGAGATYDISAPSADTILKLLQNYKQLVPDESSPAAVRAFTLAGKVNPDRTVNTDVCNDPYWLSGGLHLIYPWATLQFLCVNDWEKLGTSGGKDVFHPIWINKFLTGLRGIYDGGEGKPRIAGPADNQVLNGLTFADVGKVAVCATARNPRVRFIKIQDGLLGLQGRYERHVRRVWELLNALIIVIVDPETREQTVRLHPRVYAAKSNEYVNTQAAAARELLTEFYLGIEQDYLATVQRLEAI